MNDSVSHLRQLVRFVAGLRYEEVPAEVSLIAKLVILDSIGCAFAAQRFDKACQRALSVMASGDKGGSSPVIGTPHLAAPANAAFANGALVHALNFDPIGRRTGHIGVAAFPAPFALATYRQASGKDLIAASVAAAETLARVTLIITRAGRRPSEMFLSGQLLSYFGATAGACSVLRLDAAATESAFGLALMQMSGSRQIVLSGDAPAKNLYGAFPNSGAVISALLAENGVDARCDVFGEPAGLYRAIYGAQFDTSPIAEGLHDRYEMIDVGFKFWPCSDQAFGFVAAALDLSGKLDAADQIAELELIASAQFDPWLEPFDAKRRPASMAGAANSIPFCVACCIADGAFNLGSFANIGREDGAVASLLGKMRRSAIGSEADEKIVARLRSGTLVEAPARKSVAIPANAAMSAVIKKFRDCCNVSGLELQPHRQQEIIDAVLGLEGVSAAELGRLLTAGD